MAIAMTLTLCYPVQDRKEQGMQQTTRSEPTPAKPARIRMEIDEIFAKMEEADKRIEEYQEETARLGAETRAMIAALGSR